MDEVIISSQYEEVKISVFILIFRSVMQIIFFKLLQYKYNRF